MSTNWTQYNGKKILNLDYTGMEDDAMLKQMEAYYRILANEKDLRQLSNFGDAIVSKEFVERAKTLAAENPDSKPAKIALIGVNRHQRARVFTYNFHAKVNAQIFETEAEALEWLASDN